MTLNMDKDWWKQQKVYKKDNVWTVNGRPRETVQPSSMQKPTNLPDKTWLTLVVTMGPDAISPSHTHNGAAVVATVTKGRVLNQMIHPAGEHGSEHDSGPKIYEVGESWYEAPGCRHVRSENATGDGTDCAFVANLIMDTEKLEGPGDFASKVVVIDAEVEEQARM